VEYRIHQEKFKNMDRFYDVVRSAMNKLGHTESNTKGDINFYNHLENNNKFSNDVIILKPTAPTSKHFTLDRMGYANTSELAYKEPKVNDDIEQMDWQGIIDLRNTKPNKWDDSILLKWRPAKKIKQHILIIGQQPHDETVNGFGFGDHWKKLTMIVDYLFNEPIIVKLHPAMKIRGKVKDQIDRWIQRGIDVRIGYNSIHDFLPYTTCAIVDNSTAGIECLMHEVPVISYGWPEYHWATKKLQTLPQLDMLIHNPEEWNKPVYARQFIEWYINHYLCTDINNTMRRLEELL
jgi:hypothetical protein